MAFNSIISFIWCISDYSYVKLSILFSLITSYHGIHTITEQSQSSFEDIQHFEHLDNDDQHFDLLDYHDQYFECLDDDQCFEQPDDDDDYEDQNIEHFDDQYFECPDDGLDFEQQSDEEDTDGYRASTDDKAHNLLANDTLLYAGASITVNVTMVLLLAFTVHHKLTNKAISDLLYLIRTICPQPNNTCTLYKFRKKNSRLTILVHLTIPRLTIPDPLALC